jgi:beta-lactam-binding protein with PASTA domain
MLARGSRYNLSRMRKFFRFVAMGLILVTVGVMSALTAMRVAIHGREVAIPSFVKLSVSEAERVADRNGLAVSIEGQFYSAEIPEGRIVSQQPPAGTRVRRGWRVRLAQSLGVQRVTIPDVQGQSPRAAELNVRQRGLEIDTIAEAHIPDAPTEQVIAQSPPAAAQGVQSPKLSILLSMEPEAPMFVMPNFVGRSLAEASANIDQAGFKLAQVKTAVAPLTNGSSTAAPPSNPISGPTTVVRQSPAAGQKIAADTQIILEVSR